MNLKFSGSWSALSRLYLYFKCHAVFDILELYTYAIAYFLRKC